MTEEVTVTADGRLLCPQCSNNALQAMQDEQEVELRHVVLHHRKDASRVRFDQLRDTLVLIGDPVDGDTLEVFDEYLECPRCKSRHNVPWAEDGHQDQTRVEREGDFHKSLKPDLAPNVCPSCGGTNIVFEEDYIMSKEVVREADGVLLISDDGKIAWDCGDNARMCCYSCGAQWSPPDYDFDV